MGNIQFRDSKILFVDSKIAFGPSCCCGLGCTDCTNCAEDFDCIPNEITVTVPAFSGICLNCGDYEGDWVLPLTGVCGYELHDVDICITGSTIRVEFEVLGVLVRIGTTVGTFEMTWRKTYDDPMECTSFVNESIPWVNASPQFPPCDNDIGALPVLLTV